MLMRLLSALFAGATVLFCFLFLREVLPGTPWAWSVGALAAAVLPGFGFISGGVNNDTLLWTASAAIFLLLARILRRGLTRPAAIWLGLAVGLGICAKPNILGFVPGVAFALLLAVRRAPAGARRAAVADATLAAVLAAAPVLAFAILNVTIFDRPLWTSRSPFARPTAEHTSLAEFASYTWQLYLPRLPFMTDLLAGVPLRDSWFQGALVGRFGWLDTSFPRWAYDLAVLPFAGVGALALAGIVRARASLRGPRRARSRRGRCSPPGWPWRHRRGRIPYQKQTGFAFEQGRYLLPLLPLYAAAVALAARGGGRRWGPVVGAVLVTLALAHGLFGQLLVISRFYG